MNATEDGVEPMGESPDVPVRHNSRVGEVLHSIERGAVLGILGAADAVLATKQLAQRQTVALQAVREIHEAIASSEYPGHKVCANCIEVAPCSTIRAIDEAGA